MPDKEFGLILKKNLPSQHKLSVLTPSMGKINLIIKKTPVCQRIWPGMVVAFVPQLTPYAAYVSEDAEIISSPQPETEEDMYWIHHLLELCYHFIPHESPSTDQFHVVSCYLTLLQHKAIFQNTIDAIKTMCIVHFLQETGFYADTAIVHYQELLSTITALVYDRPSLEKNIENLKKQTHALTQHDMQKINKYIFNCLKDHPSFNLFKTIRFVYPS